MNKVQRRQLMHISSFVKGNPPIQHPYHGSDAEMYLTPEYLRGKCTAELVKPSAKSVRVKDGDAIILWDGSNAGEIFSGRMGLLASTMCLVRQDGSFDRSYFFHALKKWEPYLKSQTSGSGIPHVDKEIIGKLALYLFPHTEQTKIAEILTTVDCAIEQTEALIAKQQRIKTGLMQDLLTRGIDEQGNLRSEKTHQFKDSPLGRIPVEWEIRRLVDITNKIADRDHTTPVYVEDEVKILSPMAFYDDESIDFEICPCITHAAHMINSRKTDCTPGDIILHRIGAGLGQVRAVNEGQPEYSILHSLALIRPNQIRVTTPFLKWAFRSFVLEKQMGLGTQSIGVPDLGLDKIASLVFAIPSTLTEQQRIGSLLDKIQESLSWHYQELTKLRALKTALMQDLLTGRKRVTSLLPSEEAVNP